MSKYGKFEIHELPGAPVPAEQLPIEMNGNASGYFSLGIVDLFVSNLQLMVPVDVCNKKA